MKSKSEIKQHLMRSAVRQWGIKSGDSLDPVIQLLINAYCELAYENENSIEDIKERLLEQIAASLTPDSMIAGKPAHSVLQVMPIEPETEINRQTLFYTNRPTAAAIKYGMKTLSFAPVVNHIKLAKTEIRHLLCERNLYRMGLYGEKELLTKANAFYQDLNNSVWIGLDIDEQVKNLQGIHFYIDFPNTPTKYELYSLLSHTVWSINGQTLTMDPGPAKPETDTAVSGGIFSYYNHLQTNDDEVMELYHKQFLHIRETIKVSGLTRAPFPTELLPYFPERVKTLEADYWINVTFPAYFKQDDLDDLMICMNAIPVTNKNIRTYHLYGSRSLTGILPLPVQAGEYFLSVENVEDSHGMVYNFLPYTLTEAPLGGTYTVKRGGLERFSTRDLKNMVDQFLNMLRTELVTFIALKIDNINNSIVEMEQIIRVIQDKIESNNPIIREKQTYLLIDREDDRKDVDITADYWTTNCDLANGLPYGTLFTPLKALPFEKDSCFLLKTTSGGKSIPKKEEALMAYKYALTTRDQLFSGRDIENYCRVKYPGYLKRIHVQRGIACSSKPMEGLIRTVDVCLTPIPGYDEYFDSIALGELKTELEKRSPDTYNYRILVEN